MKKIGKLDTQARLLLSAQAPRLFEVGVKQELYSIPRSYSTLNHFCFVFFHACHELFPEHDAIMQTLLDDTLALIKPEAAGYEHFREGTLNVAGPGQSGRTWKNKNWLDNVTVRAHIVLEGAGQLLDVDTSTLLSYEPGDVILFAQEDYGHTLKNAYSGFSVHASFLFGHMDFYRKKNWELFAEQQR